MLDEKDREHFEEIPEDHGNVLPFGRYRKLGMSFSKDFGSTKVLQGRKLMCDE
jgi:hypothetical protein